MAYQQTNIPFAFTTDAEFRAFCQAVHDAITALGLVNTSDTGQINLSTVTAPAGTFTFQGYKIYRFDDTLQATKPVFIKVEFGSASNLQTRPALRFNVGTATNGAGTLATLTTGTMTMNMTSGSSSSQVSHQSGGPNRLTFGLHTGDTGNHGQLLNVERSKDADGTDNGNAVICLLMNNAVQTVALLEYPGSSNSNSPGVLVPNESSVVQDSKKAIFGVFHTPRLTKAPLHGVAYYQGGDVTVAGTQADSAIDASGVKNWLTLGTGPISSGTPPGGNGQTRLAMRYGPDGAAQSSGWTPIPAIVASTGGTGGGGTGPAVPTSGQLWPRHK